MSANICKLWTGRIRDFAIVNYRNSLSVSVCDYDGERAIVFKNENSKCEDIRQCDTYWSLTTPRFPVRDGKTYAVRVRTKSDIKLKTTKPMSSIIWFAVDGKELLAQDGIYKKLYELQLANANS